MAVYRRRCSGHAETEEVTLEARGVAAGEGVAHGLVAAAGGELPLRLQGQTIAVRQEAGNNRTPGSCYNEILMFYYLIQFTLVKTATLGLGCETKNRGGGPYKGAARGRRRVQI